VIIGTAGHIDHGKTTLVRALTGVDTDRLPEEKKRGITIELGFAPLILDGVGTVGIVDVPGHEAFVRTMLAGAAGIDVALLVVAADDGVQPQTLEHLAILELLGVSSAVVAITKTDLVAEDWLSLVAEDVRATLARTPFSGVPIIPVAAERGEGIAALRDALAAALRATPDRNADDLFRLPVDRAFSVRGTGTVVTGTVWSGSLDREADVRILPAGLVARVRGIQTHGESIQRALSGHRVAIALAGVDLAGVGRGDTIVSDDSWRPTRTLRVDVALHANAPEALGPRAEVRLHVGTAEVGATVHAAAGALQAGGVVAARLVLDGPLVARGGDRFVLRLPAPLATIGGGVVSDPYPGRRAKPFTLAGLSCVQRLAEFLGDAGAQGIASRSLAVRLGIPPRAVDAIATALGAVRIGADTLLAQEVVDLTRDRLRTLVDEHHRHAPLSPSASLQEIRSRLHVGFELADAVVRLAEAAGEIEVSGGEVRRKGWVTRITPGQEQVLARLIQRISDAGVEPPSVAELTAEFGAAAPDLLRFAQRTRAIVQVEDTRYYTPDALDGLLQRIRALMSGSGELAPSAITHGLGISRKFVIPILEYCDRLGYTVRRGEGRIWTRPL
jgi:selenocysteine-specific elongation factor